MLKFYDTCALINLQDKAFTERFYVSDITLQELEKIKDDPKTPIDLKIKVKHLGHLFEENNGLYEIVVWDGNAEHANARNDFKIIDCAIQLQEANYVEKVKFISDDLWARLIAHDVYGFDVEKSQEIVKTPEYLGYKEVWLSEEEMADFYSAIGTTENKFELLDNQYLIVCDDSGIPVDGYRWHGKYEPLFKKSTKSMYFDKVKPKDIYQQCVIDSIMNNTITAITGKAGSGKSLLSLMAAMYLVEKGEFNRLVILYNPVKVRGAVDIGYFPGSSNEKMLSGSLGNQLNSKFGDRFAIDRLMSENKLLIVSMGDCRGMEIGKEILYIPEAENTSVDLMKICLTRASSDAKIIIEGDWQSQVDSWHFEGDNNGLKRVIDAFKGNEEFGCMTLKNIWRSKIAALCELL